jgi:hypothetical protein
MTYASGGLIQASDFNNLAGGSAGANVSGQLNCVLGIGNRDVGYGQTTVSNVAQYNRIYATDWASLINKLNSVRQHQTGSGTGITAPSTGNLIQYISTLSSSITSAYSSRLSYASSGATTTGSDFNVSFLGGAGVSNFTTVTRTVTFGTDQNARYFFNAGGRLTLVASATNNNATARSTSMVTLLGTNFGSKSMYAITYGSRSGSGGTVNLDTTTGSTAGYYGASSSPTYTNHCLISPSGYYSSDQLEYSTATNFVGPSQYDANGNVIYLKLYLFSQADADALDVTVTTRVDITPPETTYLSNTWGSITVS